MNNGSSLVLNSVYQASDGRVDKVVNVMIEIMQLNRPGDLQPGDVATILKSLDQEGFILIKGNNALGQVQLTELGKQAVENS